LRGDDAGPGAPRRRHRDLGAGARPRSGEGWIYGHHAVAAALANPDRRIERLLLTRDAGETLARAGIGLRVAAEIRSAQEISTVLPEGAAHQGFALRAAPLPERALADVLAALPEGAPALAVVLDQVTDPRNVGAILRSAAAFGAAAVIQPERHGADITAALAKAASGALETVALVRVTNVSRTLDALKAAGFWCIGLDARAPEVLASVDLSGRIALVLGSEGSGLRRLVADTCDIRARLPIGPGMESLNVSAAAAIALYEVARRRG
jgi:23S rRNA (guanosine2251-2'-O)-methyltransferase